MVVSGRMSNEAAVILAGAILVGAYLVLIGLDRVRQAIIEHRGALWDMFNRRNNRP
jgi:hypothetical protein